jgi:hypothetical protein
VNACIGISSEYKYNASLNYITPKRQGLIYVNVVNKRSKDPASSLQIPLCIGAACTCTERHSVDNV